MMENLLLAEGPRALAITQVTATISLLIVHHPLPRKVDFENCFKALMKYFISMTKCLKCFAQKQILQLKNSSVETARYGSNTKNFLNASTKAQLFSFTTLLILCCLFYIAFIATLYSLVSIASLTSFTHQLTKFKMLPKYHYIAYILLPQHHYIAYILLPQLQCVHYVRSLASLHSLRCLSLTTLPSQQRYPPTYLQSASLKIPFFIRELITLLFKACLFSVSFLTQINQSKVLREKEREKQNLKNQLVYAVNSFNLWLAL